MIKSVLVYLTNPHVDAWNFKPMHRKILQDQAPGLEVTVCYHSREFLDRLPEAEAVVAWYFKKEWLEKSPRLRLIATPAAGRDWIDVEPNENLKISFGGFHGPMIAESVTGAVFYFLKAFQFSREMQEKSRWAVKKMSDRLQSLYRARVTILGFGRIGQTIGRALKPFGCQVTAVKRMPIREPDYFTAGDRVVTVENLPEVLRETDHLVLVLPGGGETQGMLKREHFKMLPPASYLYNVGRGNVYREVDLVAALENGEIAGAYLDVFEIEPLPAESSLWRMDNVLIQPHLSAASPQYLELFVREFAERMNSGELG